MMAAPVEVHAEVGVQAEHPPQPRGGGRRERARAGRERLDQPEAHEARRAASRLMPAAAASSSADRCELRRDRAHARSSSAAASAPGSAHARTRRSADAAAARCSASYASRSAALGRSGTTIRATAWRSPRPPSGARQAAAAQAQAPAALRVRPAP